MKDITLYIAEAVNKDAMFMGKTSRRTEDSFTFTVGEKVLLMKYDTDGYEAQNRGIYEIGKVNKNSIILKSDDDFYKELKFDKYGIFVKKNKNKYRGNSILYWVLYNKELSNDKDIEELLKDGSCSWHFSYPNARKKECIKDLKKYIKELNS